MLDPYNSENIVKRLKAKQACIEEMCAAVGAMLGKVFSGGKAPDAFAFSLQKLLTIDIEAEVERLSTPMPSFMVFGPKLGSDIPSIIKRLEEARAKKEQMDADLEATGDITELIPDTIPEKQKPLARLFASIGRNTLTQMQTSLQEEISFLERALDSANEHPPTPAE